MDVPAAEVPVAAPVAPVAAAQVSVVELPVPALPAAPRVEVLTCAKNAAVCVSNGSVAVWPKARLRSGYEFVQPDEGVLYVGANDGFFLDQARVGFEANIRDMLRLALTFDGASLLPGAAPNNPVNSTLTAVRDAYVAWTPGWYLRVAAGQQVMPADLEGSDIDQTLVFTRRSVLSRGIRPGHGIAVSGLSPERQLGVVVGNGDGAKFGPVPVTYALGIANGNGPNVLGNDNKLPAAYARVGAGYEDLVFVGLGGRYNPRTVGALPNLYTESDAVGFVDVVGRMFGLELALQGIYKNTSFVTLVPDASNPQATESGLGFVGWITANTPFGVDLFGLRPGYRLSYFDPSSAFATDQLLENTLAVRWDVPFNNLPLSIFADFTLMTELGDGAIQLSNNRVTALLQLDL